MDYQYNIIFVDNNDIVRAIVFSKNRLPSYMEEMKAKHDISCECCGQLLQLKKLVLAGSYRIREKY